MAAFANEKIELSFSELTIIDIEKQKGMDHNRDSDEKNIFKGNLLQLLTALVES